MKDLDEFLKSALDVPSPSNLAVPAAIGASAKKKARSGLLDHYKAHQGKQQAADTFFDKAKTMLSKGSDTAKAVGLSPETAAVGGAAGGAAGAGLGAALRKTVRKGKLGLTAGKAVSPKRVLGGALLGLLLGGGAGAAAPHIAKAT